MGIRRARSNPDRTSPAIKDRESQRVIPAREAFRAASFRNSVLSSTEPMHIHHRRLTARNPFKVFLNLIGTGAAPARCPACAKLPEVPIHMVAILLLDLAFL
jgi:hypothetical protein